MIELAACLSFAAFAERVIRPLGIPIIGHGCRLVFRADMAAINHRTAIRPEN